MRIRTDPDPQPCLLGYLTILHHLTVNSHKQNKTGSTASVKPDPDPQPCLLGYSTILHHLTVNSHVQNKTGSEASVKPDPVRSGSTAHSFLGYLTILHHLTINHLYRIKPDPTFSKTGSGTIRNRNPAY